ncbi:MAG: hypothetical protein GEU99_21420, partial [Luteitalea sp.]|nr:hypothetical protein [Luteitalea sp.]
MWRLVGSAWLALVVYDLLALGGFATVRRSVADFPKRRRTCDEEAVRRVCRAVDEACVWYVKRA